MEPTIQERIEKLAQAIGFFGKLGESHLLAGISLYLKLNDITTSAELNDAIQEMLPKDIKDKKSD